MPSVWEVAGDVLGVPVLAPLVIGGAVVSAVVSPEVRQRLRRLGVQGLAAALAAGDAARRELRAGTDGTSGLAAQFGHRLREAVAEVREDWDDFVAEAQAERERRQAGTGPQAAQDEPHSPANSANGDIVGMDDASSGGAAMHGSGSTTSRRSRSAARRQRR